jgi:catechol 2,3-dioxygenase-like lactoylglutathione lyase family enzyme
MEALRGYGGAEVELLDLSDLPQRLAVSMYYESGQRRFLLRSLEDNRTLNLAQVRSVWWRRPQAFALPAAMIDSEYRRFALSALTTALQGLYQSMDALWVNAPVNDATAGHKPFQLAIAQRIGLEIPPTLMTNDPDAAVAFWQHHEGQIVYKQFAARPDSWRETRRLRPEETALADAVQWAPVIFQRYVEAEADIRVTAVGDTLFAAAADVRHAAYPVDIRLNPDVTYHAHTLPEPVSMLLRRLMRELRLCYGAIAALKLCQNSSADRSRRCNAARTLALRLSSGDEPAPACSCCPLRGSRAAGFSRSCAGSSSRVAQAIEAALI